MSEFTFFKAAARVGLATLAGEAVVPDNIDPARLFQAVAALDRAGPDDICAFTDEDDVASLAGTRAGACFVAPSNLPKVPPHTIALVSDDPAAALGRAISILYPRDRISGPVFERGGIDPAAIIHGDANLEQGVVIDPGVVIGPRVEIGAGTTIGANSVIGAGVRIGRNCTVDSQVSLRAALIGDRVVIHAGARIGLGSVLGAIGSTHGPFLGRVIVQDDVEIGANAVIERGRLGDTMIGERSKIGTMIVIGADTLVDREQTR